MLEFDPTAVSAPAVPKAVRTLRATAASAAVRLGAPPSVVDAVRLAVSEAATLSVRRARHDEHRGVISVAVRLENDDLVVCVHDDSPPRTDLRAGLAMSLMSRVADGVEMDQPLGGGTDIVLRFSRAAVAAAR